MKPTHLLVLLLRLRQICNHPGLIKSMVDTETKIREGIEEDFDFKDVFHDSEKILKNLVFETSVFCSSKIQKLLELLEEIKNKGEGEKSVIVSQWTSMLNIVKVHIKPLGMKVAKINGSHRS